MSGRLEKRNLPGIAPRVEYALTSCGEPLRRILDSVEKPLGDVARGRV
jgi:DNA-binding HxlR family transcriptional regulator